VPPKHDEVGITADTFSRRAMQQLGDQFWQSALVLIPRNFWNPKSKTLELYIELCPTEKVVAMGIEPIHGHDDFYGRVDRIGMSATPAFRPS
jgi:hypothetical protein